MKRRTERREEYFRRRWKTNNPCCSTRTIPLTQVFVEGGERRAVEVEEAVHGRDAARVPVLDVAVGGFGDAGVVAPRVHRLLQRSNVLRRFLVRVRGVLPRVARLYEYKAAEGGARQDGEDRMGGRHDGEENGSSV